MPSRGVTAPVSRVYLPVSLTAPGPSGSTEPTRLCRGCSRPPRRSPVQASSSFIPPLRQRAMAVFHLHPDKPRLAAHCSKRQSTAPGKTGSRRQADPRPRPHQEGNDVTGGTAAIFHAGTAPRQRYQELIRRVSRLLATWAHGVWPAEMSLVVLRRLPVFHGVVWPEEATRHGSRLRRL